MSDPRRSLNLCPFAEEISDRITAPWEPLVNLLPFWGGTMCPARTDRESMLNRQGLANQDKQCQCDIRWILI